MHTLSCSRKHVRPHKRIPVYRLFLLLAAVAPGPSSLAQPVSPAANQSVSATPISAEQAQQNNRAIVESPLGACFRRPPAYPAVALRNEQTGRSIVAFTVTESGAIENPLLLRTSGFTVLDQAAFAHLVKCIALFPPDHKPKLPVGTYVLPLLWRIE